MSKQEVEGAQLSPESGKEGWGQQKRGNSISGRGAASAKAAKYKECGSLGIERI